jgi:hypothetical protein
VIFSSATPASFQRVTSPIVGAALLMLKLPVALSARTLKEDSAMHIARNANDINTVLNVLFMFKPPFNK